ncbi:MAG: hypothetical protein AAGN82_11755 [Myxococcota bacterium]
MKKTLLSTLAIATAALTWAGPEAQAVGTRRFVLNQMSNFTDGDLEGVSVASDGTVEAGLTLTDAPVPDASSIWSSVALNDGSVLLGTGPKGTIYRVKAGKVSVAAETGALAVTSMVLNGAGEVVAGSFPKGQIFKLKTSDLDGKEVKPWVTLKDTEHVWSLAYDAKKKVTYAATGPEGKLFRVSDAGKDSVFYESAEKHLVSVAIGPDGTVYSGSSGEGLLYEIRGPGRATVLHDFERTDVKAIAVTSKGVVYAVANSYNGSGGGSSSFPMGMVRPGMGGSSGSASSGSTRPGRGELMRFDASGVAEQMMESDSTHFPTLVLDEEERPVVGGAGEGRVYTVTDNHVERVIVDTEEKVVAAMSLRGPTKYIATGDPVVFHTIKGKGGPDAIWTSKVLDAGLRASFGKLEWRGEGALELQTRSGNTGKPDKTWSAWGKAMAAPGPIDAPPARYLQVRARWAKDPNAKLFEVKAAFLTDNARALLTEIKAGEESANTGGSSVPASGEMKGSPETKVNLSWKVDNPDNDKLRYRIFYQREGTKTWFALLESAVLHTSTSYTWDTAGVPEGRYRVRVDATDELVNPPDKVTKHSLTSRTFAVDNTAPAITNLKLAGTRLTGAAADQVGPIAHLEFSLVGKKTWFPIHPADGVFDEASETFDVDVSSQIPKGPHLVVVRAYDQSGNKAEATVGRN